MARKTCAFTLVELLVVVAIIGLLIAILIPILARARDRAQTVSCLAGVRQVQTLWTMYIESQETGAIPSTKTTYKHPNWIDALDSILETDIKFGGGGSDVGTCPVVHQARGMSYPGIRWGYTVNIWWSSDPKEYNEGKSWRHIRHPSDYPWFVDGLIIKTGTGHSIPAYVPHTYYGAPTYGIGANHDNGNLANNSFADGSARSTSIAQIKAKMHGEDNFPWLENR